MKETYYEMCELYGHKIDATDKKILNLIDQCLFVYVTLIVVSIGCLSINSILGVVL